MSIKYRIQLSCEEQANLKELIHCTKVAKHKRIHAQILISLDENGPGLSEVKAADVCAVSVSTVQRVRKRCVEEGLDVAVQSKFSNKGRPRRMDGEQHAHLIALTCSKPPSGNQSWSMKLLADKLIELEVVPTISPATVCRESSRAGPHGPDPLTPPYVRCRIRRFLTYTEQTSAVGL